jgi:type IV pilus assembly protein PilA
MTKLIRDRDDDAGFTMIELLVVVIVIGALAGIATSVFLGQRNKAAASTAVSDLRNAATAEEAQLGSGGSYVTSVATLVSQGFRQSPNTTFGIAVTAAGYCEVAKNGTRYWWFDSAAGGVQRTTTTTLTPPASANGICASNAPTSVG